MRRSEARTRARSLLTCLVLAGIPLAGCRSASSGAMGPTVDPGVTDTARWCTDAPTAQTLDAARCALRPGESVSALRGRYPGIDFDARRPYLAIGVAHDELAFALTEDGVSRWRVHLAPGVWRRDDDAASDDADSVMVAGDSARLVGVQQAWYSLDSLAFRRTVTAAEAGLRGIGARVVGCRVERRVGLDITTEFRAGDRAFTLRALADTVNTQRALRLDVVLSSTTRPGPAVSRVAPGCTSPARTDFGPVIEIALRTAETPSRIRRRRQYLGGMCAVIRGHPAMPAECLDVDDDGTPAARRDSLTRPAPAPPRPAPPPIPASS